MTKNNEIDKFKFTLPVSGVEVEFARKPIGRDLITARKMSANDENTLQIFIAAQIATFNGKKIPAEEILDFDLFDVAQIESELLHFAKKSRPHTK